MIFTMSLSQKPSLHSIVSSTFFSEDFESGHLPKGGSFIQPNPEAANDTDLSLDLPSKGDFHDSLQSLGSYKEILIDRGNNDLFSMLNVPLISK